jgi:hypothetical protein
MGQYVSCRANKQNQQLKRLERSLLLSDYRQPGEWTHCPPILVYNSLYKKRCEYMIHQLKTMSLGKVWTECHIGDKIANSDSSVYSGEYREERYLKMIDCSSNAFYNDSNSQSTSTSTSTSNLDLNSTRILNILLDREQVCDINLRRQLELKDQIISFDSADPWLAKRKHCHGRVDIYRNSGFDCRDNGLNDSFDDRRYFVEGARIIGHILIIDDDLQIGLYNLKTRKTLNLKHKFYSRRTAPLVCEREYKYSVISECCQFISLISVQSCAGANRQFKCECLHIQPNMVLADIYSLKTLMNDDVYHRHHDNHPSDSIKPMKTINMSKYVHSYGWCNVYWVHQNYWIISSYTDGVRILYIDPISDGVVDIHLNGDYGPKRLIIDVYHGASIEDTRITLIVPHQLKHLVQWYRFLDIFPVRSLEDKNNLLEINTMKVQSDYSRSIINIPEELKNDITDEEISNGIFQWLNASKLSIVVTCETISKKHFYFLEYTLFNDTVETSAKLLTFKFCDYKKLIFHNDPKLITVRLYVRFPPVPWIVSLVKWLIYVFEEHYQFTDDVLVLIASYLL